MYFFRVGTNVYKVGCTFLACRGESVKYQSCLIIPRPLLTLVTDPNFSHLAIGLSVNLMASRLHFLACRLMTQACLYQVSGLSQIWSSRLYVMKDCAGSVTVQSVTLAGLSVSVPYRPVNFPGQSVNFHDWVLESGVLYNQPAQNSNRQAVTDRPAMFLLLTACRFPNLWL